MGLGFRGSGIGGRINADKGLIEGNMGLRVSELKGSPFRGPSTSH